MMLHRHFEQEANHNMTTLADVTPHIVEEGHDIAAPLPVEGEKPKRGRRKKTEE